MKLSSICGIVKMKTNFIRNSNQNYRSECIQCCSVKRKEVRNKNCEKIKNPKKQFYINIWEKIRNQQKKDYDENLDVIIKKNKLFMKK